MKEKRFIVRKYVMAHTAAEAIRKESKVPVDEVFVDDKQPPEEPPQQDAIGFSY